MDNNYLLDPREVDRDNDTQVTEADDDDIPEATFCKVCSPILSDNSYEWWSKFWQSRGQKNDSPWHSDSLPCPGQHHQSFQSLEESVDQGCYICSRLDIPRGDVDPGHFPFRYRLCVPFEDEQARGSYKIHISFTNPARSFSGKSFYVRPRYPVSPLQQLADLSKCRTWTGHSDVARVAKGWVEKCSSSHEFCLKPSADKWRPTRLLDVSEDQIRLVSGKSEKARQNPYITLSHCWGMEPFSVLRTTNMPLYVEGVSINDFEPTFRETITTVRRLGVRYLWIDCHCVIQGSDAEAVADWEFESRQMGKVYANSFLNIGALESTAPSQGLFRNRLPSALNGKILWSPTKEDGRKCFYITLASRWPPDLELRFAFLTMPASYPLMKRGWVIQECVLAPRMLSFGSDDVFWQCSQMAASEAYANGSRPRDRSSSIDTLSNDPFWLLGSSDSGYKLSVQETKSRWLGTLSAYCQSHLTYPEKDLFVALDGIGAELLKISGSQFKYGIWDSTLPEALLYGVDTSDELPKRNEIAPTWHWSAVYPTYSYGTLKSTYEFVNSGRDRLFRLAYAFMSDDCKPLPSGNSEGFWPHMLVIGRLVILPPHTNRDECYDTQKDREDSFSKELVYLPLFCTVCYGNDPWFWGLILVRPDSGTYRRLGYWEVSVDSDEDHESSDWITRARPQLIVLE